MTASAKENIFTPETYQALKARQAKEFNEFEGIFFAFNNDQFKEGMEKIGLTVDDTKKIFSIGHGGYMLKTQNEAFGSMMQRHEDEKKNRKQDEKFLLEALTYELRNHEYCITYDPSDALDVLGLRKEDIDPKILKEACKLAV